MTKPAVTPHRPAVYEHRVRIATPTSSANVSTPVRVSVSTPVRVSVSLPMPPAGAGFDAIGDAT